MSTKLTQHLAEAQKYADKVAKDLLSITELITIGDISARPETYYDSVEQALKHQNNLKTLETQLVKAGETDPYQEQIDELKIQLCRKYLGITVNTLNSLKEHQEFLLKLLTAKTALFVRRSLIRT
jgi:hypothetical protein